MEWETVIGIEVHTQLATNTKIFSGASTRYGAEPNTQACAVDLAMPGTLPVLNKRALEMAIQFGLAVEGEINPRSVFARKNYFYPDLPKGYQISQYDQPVVKGGSLNIYLKDGVSKTIGITRAHLEEDAGKSLHEDFQGLSAIDLNRAGTPLLEIVSEPDLCSAEEAVAYLKTLHSLLRYLEISDGNMQEGSFRADVNVSVRKKGDSLGTRAEIKNLNSFRFVEKAIFYEVERQIAIIESGGKVMQETRLYDAVKNETRALRSKEAAHDYRYFPDPDLLPVVVSEEMIEKLASQLPELPKARATRFETQYQLSAYDANVLVAHKEMAEYFEALVAKTKDAKLSANWLMGEVSAYLNKHHLEIENCPISSVDLAVLIQRILDGTLSGRTAKELFAALWNKEGSVDELITQKGLRQISDTGLLEKVISDVITNNPSQVNDYRSGKDKLFGFFVGQVMKATEGRADPSQVNTLLKEKLKG